MLRYPLLSTQSVVHKPGNGKALDIYFAQRSLRSRLNRSRNSVDSYCSQKSTEIRNERRIKIKQKLLQHDLDVGFKNVKIHNRLCTIFNTEVRFPIKLL